MSTPTAAPETETPAPAATPPATPEPTKALAPAAPRPVVAFDADDPVSLYMNTGIFEQLQRVAKMMARANLVPAHLRSTANEDKTADCFLVAAQAFRWRMDPFTVAQHTFVTQGKLGYEGKLIAGLINASGKTEENLQPVYFGDEGTPQRGVRIVARLKGSKEDREIKGTVAQWKTQNDKWVSMPDQMLFYRGAREWARRHMPEVMLGIQADEEIGETVAMERRSDGAFAPTPPTTLKTLTAQLEGASTVKGDLASHSDVEIPEKEKAAAPSRVPGEDDGEPASEAALHGPATAAAGQDPAFLRGQSGPEKNKGAAPRQGKLTEG